MENTLGVGDKGEEKRFESGDLVLGKGREGRMHEGYKSCPVEN